MTKQPDFTAAQMRNLTLTKLEREQLEWALGASIDYVEREQWENDNLAPGEEPQTMLADVLYRLRGQLPEMRPSPGDPNFRQAVAAEQAAERVAVKIEEAAAEAAFIHDAGPRACNVTRLMNTIEGR